MKSNYLNIDSRNFKNKIVKAYLCNFFVINQQIKKNTSSMLILGQSCFLGPKIFEINNQNDVNIEKGGQPSTIAIRIKLIEQQQIHGEKNAWCYEKFAC